jgi:hypothetical protein
MVYLMKFLLTMRLLLVSLLFCFVGQLPAQKGAVIRLVKVDTAWAGNSVNAVIFRKNSMVTFGDTQFIAYYNNERFVVLGKRKSGAEKWQLKTTPYKGNAADAHNTISIMADGEGYLHVAWDHHNNPLNYCKSASPGSLELTERLSMTGSNEQKVSYPEFYSLAGGNMLFFYRDGGSGNGNLVINQYSIHTKKWTSVQSNLVDGQARRNAYWQACTDVKGTIHISWVWRESPDVASNHDLCYARSNDGGKTWEKSTGEKYNLPITEATAEYVCKIPQKSELINQTSMVADEAGHPFIATYWKEKGDSIPQYHVVYKNGNGWKVQNLGFRKTPFSLSGVGTKRIPISRPQIVTWKRGKNQQVALIFRDIERGDKASVAISSNNLKGKWTISDLDAGALGNWEPTYDTELWKQKKILNLFIQNVVQADAEGKADIAPQPVQVLEWDLKNNY